MSVNCYKPIRRVAVEWYVSFGAMRIFLNKEASEQWSYLDDKKKQQEDFCFGSFGHDGDFPAVSAPLFLSLSEAGVQV